MKWLLIFVIMNIDPIYLNFETYEECMDIANAMQLEFAENAKNHPFPPLTTYACVKENDNF